MDLHRLRHSPDSPRLAAVLALVLLAQALLPLGAHSDYAQDDAGRWLLVCTLAGEAPPGGDEAEHRPAPGILFAQLAGYLLGPDVPAPLSPELAPIRLAPQSAPSPVARQRVAGPAIRAPPFA